METPITIPAHDKGGLFAPAPATYTLALRTSRDNRFGVSSHGPALDSRQRLRRRFYGPEFTLHTIQHDEFYTRDDVAARATKDVQA
jgi:hypothetical protein